MVIIQSKHLDKKDAHNSFLRVSESSFIVQNFYGLVCSSQSTRSPVENLDKSLEVVNHVFAAKGLPSLLFRHKTLQQCLH